MNLFFQGKHYTWKKWVDYLSGVPLTVHDGKGKKDWTVPLPETLIPELKDQLQTVIDLHQQDLDSGYAGTFLPDLLGKEYKNAAKNWSGNGSFRGSH